MQMPKGAELTPAIVMLAAMAMIWGGLLYVLLNVVIAG
jgi:hypothetical protein